MNAPSPSSNGSETYEKARYYPEDRKLLLELEPFVEHYEVIARDFPRPG